MALHALSCYSYQLKLAKVRFEMFLWPWGCFFMAPSSTADKQVATPGLKFLIQLNRTRPPKFIEGRVIETPATVKVKSAMIRKYKYATCFCRQAKPP